MRYQEHGQGALRVPVRALVAAIAGLILILAAQTSTSTRTAFARPTDILSINPNICISLMRVIEADCSGNGSYTAGECDAACAAGLAAADGLNDLARGLGADVSATVGALPESAIGACGDGLDNDAVPDGTIDDGCAVGYNDTALFQDLDDLSGAQLNKNTGKLWVLTFVTNDGVLTLEADEGIWHSNGASNVSCPGADQDCNDEGITGDKIVVDMLLGNGVADLGDALLVATQAGVDVIYDYVVVGDPVGGIAEYPPLDPGAAASAHGSSGPSTLAVAGLAAGAALLLTAGSWYVRRRSRDRVS